MEEVTYNNTLVVMGNLITGDDGILDATENVTWQHKDGQTKEQYLAWIIANIPNFECHQGDYDISGKKVFVNGGLFVYGDMVYDITTFKGRVSAGSVGKYCM